MGNRCARRWVTPKWHAGSPTGGGQDAVAGGYPDVVARGVCAAHEAGRKQSARAVPAFRNQSEDRLQVAGAPCAGGGRAVLRPLAAAASQPGPHRQKSVTRLKKGALTWHSRCSCRPLPGHGEGFRTGRWARQGRAESQLRGAFVLRLGQVLASRDLAVNQHHARIFGFDILEETILQLAPGLQVHQIERIGGRAPFPETERADVEFAPRHDREDVYCLYSSLNSVISSRIPVSASAATPSTDTLVAIALTPKSSRSTRCANRLIMSTFLSAASSSIPWRISATRRTRLSIE